jgi:hypothetical protein
MPKMRERCASRSAKSPSAIRERGPVRRFSVCAFGVAALLVALDAEALAAARRIVLIDAPPELARSVDVALYPWDIAVVEVEATPPDGTSPDAAASARSIAAREHADAVAWIERGEDAPTLWFFDDSDGSLRSHPLPPSPQDDPAELAAVALTLKTLVRAAPWESRLAVVKRARTGAGWESSVALEALARVPTSGASGEPRLGLWVAEWYGTSRWMWGAALGTSAGLGMTFDEGNSHGSLQDIDVRGSLRGRLLFGRRFLLEPKLGGSAHVERASVTSTAPPTSETFTRVDPSLDAGLSLGWQVTDQFAWSIGAEALAFLRYQRWLEGENSLFAPSPLWIQAGSSIAWSFK